MNVLVSTTQGWNPGDDFIRIGVQNLIEDAFDVGVNWFFYNRNPDLDYIRPRHLSNFVSLEDVRSRAWDLMVFAGSPEWESGRTAPLVQAALARPDMPVVFLGIGSYAQGEKPKEATVDLMRQPRTLVTCRNNYLNTTLSDFGVPSTLLPCPAFFCSRILSEPLTRKGRTIIFHNTGNMHRPMPEDQEQQMLDAHSKGGWELLCHAFPEAYRCMEKEVSYTFLNDPTEIIQFLGKQEVVVATRLHGAIAAASFGVPAILTTVHGNHRISEAAAPFALPFVHPVKDAVAQATHLLDSGDFLKEHQRLADLKRTARQQYLTLLRNFIYS